MYMSHVPQSYPSGNQTIEPYALAKPILIPFGDYFQVKDDFLDFSGTPEQIGINILHKKCSCMDKNLSIVIVVDSSACRNSESAALDTEEIFPVFLLNKIENGVQKNEGMTFEVVVVTVRCRRELIAILLDLQLPSSQQFFIDVNCSSKSPFPDTLFSLSNTGTAIICSLIDDAQ
ncbi:uncharacterized protein ARMOST_07615 [Armillaria ostoyae]|uniref:(2E,6E)-farnesyl diphosphate synthase n=1 Tax=Armillaria ostoyae TaxID=47428 RepID=A0A284R6C1_ARMOS|nr:uncharacterized protein ARMOST_07615 [Armillaria ostoyae]